MNSEKLNLSYISPVCILRMLARNLWMVIAAALIFSMATAVYIENFRTPVYRASMTYAVTAKKGNVYSNANITSAKEVAAVVAELIETDVITDNLRKSSPDLADFSGKISASLVPESNFISVSAEDVSPKKAYVALTSLAEIFPSLSDYISDSSVVQIIRNPQISSYPVNTLNEKRLCLIAAALGAGVTALLLCRMSVKRETVQTKAGARGLLDSPIIASVGHEKKKRGVSGLFSRSKQGLQVFNPTTSFAYTEQISKICSQLDHENAAHGLKVFLVAGVGENEGKSTIAANVASALAMSGKNTALIDADLRKPSMNLFFDGKYGGKLPLNRFLAGPFTKNNLFNCMERHDKLGLYMLFPLESDKRSTELLTGATMQTLLRQLRVLDYIIIDSPPMGLFPDAEALAESVDASLLVVRQDYTSSYDINDAIDTLKNSSSKFLGCVLNDMSERVHSYGYGYGKYGYAKYGYGKYGYGERRKTDKHGSSHE